MCCCPSAYTATCNCGNGTCDGITGACTCKDGFTGTSCDQRKTFLTSRHCSLVFLTLSPNLCSLSLPISVHSLPQSLFTHSPNLCSITPPISVHSPPPQSLLTLSPPPPNLCSLSPPSPPPISAHSLPQSLLSLSPISMLTFCPNLCCFLCAECAPGKYGTSCALNCPNCQNPLGHATGSCLPADGTCVCQAGYRGALCSDSELP